MNIKRILIIFFFLLIAIGVPLIGINQIIFYPIPPITIGEDLTKIDLCQIIPIHNIEKVMGYKLSAKPAQYNHYITGASGCLYRAIGGGYHPGDGRLGVDTHTAFVVLIPIDAYHQPSSENTVINDIGNEAYFNGTERQLWVKVNDRIALSVAFIDDDIPNEEGEKAIAKLMVSAIK